MKRAFSPWHPFSSVATDAFALFLVADKVHVALPALLMAGENMVMFGGTYGIFPYILLILTLLVAVAAHLHDLLHDILTSFLVPSPSSAHSLEENSIRDANTVHTVSIEKIWVFDQVLESKLWTHKNHKKRRAELSNNLKKFIILEWKQKMKSLRKKFNIMKQKQHLRDFPVPSCSHRHIFHLAPVFLDVKFFFLI